VKILVLGADGYLGWPTAMALSRAGHAVAAVDSYIKRTWERDVGVRPLLPIPDLDRRVAVWREVSGETIRVIEGDLTEFEFVDDLIASERPDAVIHYAEQPSAPYSMIDARHAVATQVNNVVGTLNLLFALRDRSPETHLVKLGTMGEYGTPNIDIEEGYLTVTHNGRSDTFLYPKTPGSIYHLSKVHDSNNIHFATRVWGLRGTDLNQGVVYGIETDESALHDELATSFHYDEIFGTALNRFCVQAAVGRPLTVYGKGGQTRGFLNIRDTVRCIELAIANPADPGEMRVYNQFTETFTVGELANRVASAARHLGWPVSVDHVDNPRIEAEHHYYNPRHSKLLALGLTPRLLTDELIDTMLAKIALYADSVDERALSRRVLWATANRDAVLH